MAFETLRRIEESISTDSLPDSESWFDAVKEDGSGKPAPMKKELFHLYFRIIYKNM